MNIIIMFTDYKVLTLSYVTTFLHDLQGVIYDQMKKVNLSKDHA